MLSRWNQIVGQNLAACHRCPLRQEICRGACACTRDGRDIIALAEEGACPMGKHSTPPSRGLGDTVARIANAIGANKAAKMYEHISGHDCGCGKRKSRLNELVPYKD
ncbi:MAG TPA: hypothetical protein VH370_17105 [Humisphaera sp.]|jgi:hypothetical protein|nr:hypothetical protein [Humisphaera sp.]